MTTLSPVDNLRRTLGSNVVLLAAGKGKKNPMLPGWQKVQRESMDDPA